MHWLNDNETMPQYRPKRPHVLHVGRAAALVVNAETCAHVGLIGRFGAAWFREIGTPTQSRQRLGLDLRRRDAPDGARGAARYAAAHRSCARPAPTPIPRPSSPAATAARGSRPSTWTSPTATRRSTRSAPGRRRRPGRACPKNACGLAETHRVVQWMANESSRQCGPCAFGLPALAEDLARSCGLARPRTAVLIATEESAAPSSTVAAPVATPTASCDWSSRR